MWTNLSRASRTIFTAMSTVNIYYRNNVDLFSIEGLEIEAHSLWVCKNNELTLVDDDQFATTSLDESFYKI